MAARTKEERKELLKSIIDSSAFVALIMVLVQLAFAAAAVWIKWTLQNERVDPVVYAFMRSLLATPVLFILAYAFERAPMIKYEDMLSVMLMGLCVATLGLSFLIGINMTSAVYVSIFQPLCPVLTGIIAATIKLEPFQLRTVGGATKIIGILLASLGAILVVALKGNFGEPRNAVIGNIATIVSVLSYAFYMILQKFALRKYPPITTTAWVFVYGTLFLGFSLLGCVEEEKFLERWVISGNAWIAISYGAFGTSVFCFILTSWGVRKTSATLVTAFMPLEVVAVVILSAIFLDYELVLSDILGGVTVILGLLSVVGGNYYEERKAKKQKSAAVDYALVSATTELRLLAGGEDEEMVTTVVTEEKIS